jgi:hypothetical protein
MPLAERTPSRHASIRPNGPYRSGGLSVQGVMAPPRYPTPPLREWLPTPFPEGMETWAYQGTYGRSERWLRASLDGQRHALIRLGRVFVCPGTQQQTTAIPVRAYGIGVQARLYARRVVGIGAIIRTPERVLLSSPTSPDVG